MRPRRATSVTAPEICPASMYRFITSWIRCSRSAEKPVSSAVPLGTLARVTTTPRRRHRDTTEARATERTGTRLIAVLLVDRLPDAVIGMRKTLYQDGFGVEEF